MDNKTLADTLARKLEIPRAEAEGLIRTLAGVVGERGADLDSVCIPSFGTFEPRKRAERVALHPATGVRLLVPPKITLAFKPSVSLKQRIRNGK